MMLSVAAQALAVPAKPGLCPVTMPDGSVVMVQRVGDELRHYTLNADGALLMPDAEGFYQLATINADGKLVASKTPVLFRSEAIQNRIKAADRLKEESTAVTRTAPTMHRAGQYGLFPEVDFPTTTGSPKALVVLVQFTDLKFYMSNTKYCNPAEDPLEYFTAMMSEQGFSKNGATGSVLDYFTESSMGLFTPEFDVYGPVTLSHNTSYYAANDDAKAYEMAVEACQQLDSQINFAEYDTDNNGTIDNVFIIYAGQGAASYGKEGYNVWPHQYNVSTMGYKFDGKTLGNYACTNEWESSRPDGIGTFVHEFSHVMGLPDLYATDYGTAEDYTPGAWSALDSGPYNNDGRTPPAYSAFERNALGWGTGIELESNDETYELTDLRTTNKFYCISNPSKPREFFLLEYRQQAGSDLYLPGQGMLVWHVDYNTTKWNNNVVNNTATHQYVDLVEADGVASKSARTAADCFPGTKSVTYLKTSWWSGDETGIVLRKIAEGDDVLTFVSATPTDVDWLTVSQVQDQGVSNTSEEVRGYLVGYLKSGSYKQSNATFSNENVTLASNILLCDIQNPTSDDWKSCIPVQLPANSDIRSALNLQDNPDVIGSYVSITGTIANYCSTTGIKSPTAYSILSSPANGGTDSGIEEVTADDLYSASATWYTLRGQRIAAPTTAGIYLRRTAAGTAKVRVP